MNDKKEVKQENELSLKDIILKFRTAKLLILKSWKFIIICGVLGGLIGLAFAFIKKRKYTATCTFVLEENKSSGLSQYAGLASMAGINLGGSESGIFEGDNIIELYRSRAMISKTLLTKIKVGGKSLLLIDLYVDFLKLRDQWAEKDHLSQVNFLTSKTGFSRKQDSLMSAIVLDINKNVLNVNRPDKKLDIIAVSANFGDELFAKEFNDKLVETVNEFYIRTKTKKAAHNVEVLQRQADSVRSVLNNSLIGVASAIDASPNANPMLLSLRVPSQRRQIDVQSSSVIYGEIVKNLELSKISLLQETPLIQVMDEPVLPLPVEKASKTKFLLAGFLLLSVLSIIWVCLQRIFKNAMQ